MRTTFLLCIITLTGGCQQEKQGKIEKIIDSPKVIQKSPYEMAKAEFPDFAKETFKQYTSRIKPKYRFHTTTELAKNLAQMRNEPLSGIVTFKVFDTFTHDCSPVIDSPVEENIKTGRTKQTIAKGEIKLRINERHYNENGKFFNVIWHYSNILCEYKNGKWIVLETKLPNPSKDPWLQEIN